MKKIILFLTVVLLTACSTTVINDTETYAVVEDVRYSNCKNYNYIVTAWQYQPKIKRYEIHTDSLYKINTFIKIKNKEVK